MTLDPRAWISSTTVIISGVARKFAALASFDFDWSWKVGKSAHPQSLPFTGTCAKMISRQALDLKQYQPPQKKQYRALDLEQP